MQDQCSTPPNEREIGGDFVRVEVEDGVFVLTVGRNWSSRWCAADLAPDDARWLRDRLDAFLIPHERVVCPECEASGEPCRLCGAGGYVRPERVMRADPARPGAFATRMSAYYHEAKRLMDIGVRPSVAYVSAFQEYLA
jgi:hypothetical protein